MKRTNIHFHPELLLALAKHCKRTGVLRAEFIRRAVEAALRRVERAKERKARAEDTPI